MKHGTFSVGGVGWGGYVAVSSPQSDHPVENEEDKEGKQQHVAVDPGLAASGKQLQSAHRGLQKPTRGVKVRVLRRVREGRVNVNQSAS